MQTTKPEINLPPVFLDMDGAADDLLSLITLLTLPSIKLTGISVTEGNCISTHAVETIFKIFSLFGVNTIEVALSDAKALNPFPIEWREKGGIINQLDLFQKITPLNLKVSENEASDFMASKILAELNKTTIVLTGPATNLVNTIQKHPEIVEKIEKILWMAGAFMANGNVISPDHDGSAEWNIFWDPVSAQKLIRSGLKIIMFPLDVCNQVPIDNYLMYQLNEQSEYRLSELVYSILNTLISGHREYYMWDVLPPVYLGYPDILHLSNTSIEIEQRGTSKGNIYKTSKGSPIYFASCIDDEKFYNYFSQLMQAF